jgi:ABC-type antimicrobial peptide transport system permease subunit
MKLIMLRSYIKIAWRHICKNWFHSSINVLGLSIGLGLSFLIAGYVWNELRVNDDLKNASSQFIIQSKWKNPDMGYEIATLAPLAKALKEQYPGLVANYYRYDGVTSNVSKGDKVFREGLQVGDSTFLNMYGFDLLYGDERTALSQPFSVVLTEEKARKYFGKTDVVGETITIESFSGTKHDFLITGVMKTPVENSVTQLSTGYYNEFYIPAASIGFFGRNLDQWENAYIAGYIQLQKGVQPEDLQKPMEQLIRQNASPQTAANLTPYIVALKDYHLKKEKGLVIKMLLTVSFIALFILVMAVINFVNVSISKSSTRIKEIGVRKVMGGLKNQLVQQFMIESIVLVFIATLIALAIYTLSGSFFSEIIGKQLPRLSSFHVSFLLVPLILTIVIGCLAGVYPALVLSNLKAVDSVKGKLTSIKENILFRKTLVGFQFFTASIVFAGVLIITKQINMFFGNSLGYDKELIISAQVPRDWSEAGIQRMQMIKNELATLPQVRSVSLSWSIPDGAGIGSLPVYTKGKDSTQALPTEAMVTDENYIHTYSIPIQAGRFFSDRRDSASLVLNETAAKALGWKNVHDAIGEQLFLPGNSSGTIIGVTKDFHFGSMQEKIKPMTFVHTDASNMYRYLSFKLKPGDITGSLETIQKKWSALLPGSAFEYRFMDETLARLYRSEMQLKKAAQLATVLAFVIVMLGIIGLISLNLQKRTKEIGIRKVLGASAFHISYLFLKEFLPAILISGLVSIPVAAFIMQGWLDDYDYRISLTAQPFLIAITVLGLLTIFLIIIQITKTVMENPVKSLRTE